MNDMASAFDELIQCNAETLSEPGKPVRAEFAIINGKKHECIAEEISSSEIAIGGGVAEGEQFRLKTRKREFSSLPMKGDPVTFRRIHMEVVGPTIDRNGIEYEITVGDLTAGER